MIRRIGLKGLAYWRAVWKVAPWDEYQAERRHGQLMALLAAVNGAEKAKPQDFMAFRIGAE